MIDGVLEQRLQHHRRQQRIRGRAVELPDDAQALAYVRMLEQQFDRRSEASMPTGDDLAAEFEKFLREQNPDDQ